MSKIKSETLFLPIRLYVFIFKLQSNPQETPTWKVPIVQYCTEMPKHSGNISIVV